MEKDHWRKMLPIIKEWVENEDAALIYRGDEIFNPSFESPAPVYKIIYPKKTILVNGVEVPAPETKMPEIGAQYYTPQISALDRDKKFKEYPWDGGSFDKSYLEAGLIYLNKEDAIERAKAMMLYKEIR